MGVKLVSSGGGSVEINPPATASSFTATMPAGTGNVVVNGINGALVAATAQNSTSGTSIDFTGIPSWARRITVMFNGVSLSGTSNYLIQIGAGSVSSSGYVSSCNNITGSVSTTSTSGYLVTVGNAAADLTYGHVTLCLMGSDDWTQQAVLNNGSSNRISAGWASLSAPLDRVRITTVNGTDTFDAGSINILYE